MTDSKYAIDEVVAQHQTVYDVYFSQADSTGSGAIGALDAGNFLKHSKLKSDELKNIWELSDPTGKGYLDRQSFYIALKLIALVQSGQDPKLENIESVTGAPKLGDLSSNITSLITPDDPWYIKASLRISFDKIFDSLSPINDKITGARVKPFLLNSGLPVDILGKIWELSDLDQDGNLDREEFLIAMQLMGKAKEGAVLPDQLPPSLLPFKVRHTSMNSSFSLGSPSSLSSPRLNIGSPYSVNETKPWVVSIEEKAKSDLIFDQIDVEKKGFATGNEVKEEFIKTGLSQKILATIWNLCDIGSTGKLNSEQFALAMHFINKKLATGLDAPPELLPEMIPPSLRKKSTTEMTIESKELEELQLQITELQREKLFYEQRASEHDSSTKKKRRELANLELEMESLFKTLQDRELKKVEEVQKLSDLEDKLTKIDMELVDLKEKYNGEKTDVESLKQQINTMESTMKSRDNDFNDMKAELKKFSHEQTNLEIKLDMRRNNLNELSNNLKSATTEVGKNTNKIDLLKSLQDNLNKLLKEYDDLTVTDQNQTELNDEIKRLEEENSELTRKVKEANDETNHELSFKLNKSIEDSKEPEPPLKQDAFVTDFFLPKSANNFIVEDPFQAFDPFKENNNDPFKESEQQNDPFKENADDPFKDNSTSLSDPFASAVKATSDPFAAVTGATNDPFLNDPFGTVKSTPFNDSVVDGFETEIENPFANIAKKKDSSAPPRPAPPRAQTPSLKPVKVELLTQRPQSSMDFTRNTKLDLFNDFADPFQSKPAPIKINETDPFGAGNAGWDAFASSDNRNNSKTNDAWDPFG